MQLPRGASVDPTARRRRAMLRRRHAAPILPTVDAEHRAPLPVGAPPAMPLEWRYEIGVEIARGGMGRVVEATDTVLGRTVALKEALSLDPESLRRFQRETRITARLEHPSIVPVHDAGVAPNGSPFYVMRKISGRPLEELVGRRRSLARAARAAAAHRRGGERGRARARARHRPSRHQAGEHPRRRARRDDRDRLGAREGDRRGRATPSHARRPRRRRRCDDDSLKTRAGIVFGTPGFMAPEQLRGARRRRALRCLRARRDAVPPARAPAAALPQERRRDDEGRGRWARRRRCASSCPACRPSSRRSSTRRSRTTPRAATRTPARSPRISSGS